MTHRSSRPVALVTGASAGLGQALASGLAEAGWNLVIDARTPGPLALAADRFRAQQPPGAETAAVAGDVADPAHRQALADVVGGFGRLDLLVNNASVLGPSPQPALADYPLDVLRQVYEVNTVAPLALLQLLRPALEASDDPRVINVTSDASVEPYEGWGGYGSSKAALDHLGAIWAAEQAWCRTWTVDPGDLRTRLHQEAFPGEDISDRPEPETVVPVLLWLIDSETPSGRLRLSELVAPAETGGGTPR
jgi:NAD(P)-dependent dehydrogenase (short-subunit alcohol dehydrogenase family)